MPINSISKVNLEIFLSCRYQKLQGSAVDPVLFGLIKRENFMPSQKLLITVFYFLKRRYNSCTIKFTLLGSIIQCLLVYSQNYATITIPYYKHFHQLKKEPFTHQSLPLSLSPAPGHHHSAFCFYGYAYSGYFLEMEPYSMRAFVAGFFYLVSTMFTRLIHNRACFMQMHSFLRQNNILLHGYILFCLSLNQLADTWAAPTFWQL